MKLKLSISVSRPDHSEKNHLRDSSFERILNMLLQLALLGNFKSDNHKKPAVLIIQTAAMDSGALNQLLTGLSLHEILVNDIYSTFQGDVSRDVKPYKVRGARCGKDMAADGSANCVLLWGVNSTDVGELDLPGHRASCPKAHRPELSHGGGDEGGVPIDHKTLNR
ncbi:unnamed protein product [Phytophthora lilii]|uniref:Unnamed protein product n=1 Tax=Phytophthora lilii TaxID=2077276 RepID=A0A9W6TBD1_9STRA|nr:unnamed protein product [Phytophthora lilii]